MSNDLIGGPCRRCGQQGIFDCCSDEPETITSYSEAEKLREAIRDAGFAVMQTSGRWSIHDVSELGKAEQAKTDKIISENIDLEIKVKQIKTAVKEAFDLYCCRRKNKRG